MDWPLFNICLLTLVIHLIGALAYAARIAGVRTHKIALSFALFNVLVLVSRTSNSFLGPFLAKRIENAIADGTGERLLMDMRLVLLWAIVATILGALAGLLASGGLVRVLSLISPTGNTPVVTWQAQLLAVAFSAGVGILAGIFPAFKAARLSPIQALRYG